jgi:hypothetical protein
MDEKLNLPADLSSSRCLAALRRWGCNSRTSDRSGVPGLFCAVTALSWPVLAETMTESRDREEGRRGGKPLGRGVRSEVTPVVLSVLTSLGPMYVHRDRMSKPGENYGRIDPRRRGF